MAERVDKAVVPPLPAFPRALSGLLPGGHPPALRRDLPDPAAGGARAAGRRAWQPELVRSIDLH
jgi:hypothetical protein